MDRRDFLKSLAQVAAAAGTASLASLAPAAAPPRITVAAVGDCIPTRRVSERRDAPFLDLVELLRGADCVWGNCETVFADPGRVHPAYKSVDPYTICEPWGAAELAWLGIRCMGTANNHILDWGVEGMVSTLEHLARAGIAHAGSGPDLARAARPGYCDVQAGRVAQVNFATTFEPHFAAAEAHPYVLGRPGLNPLRTDRIVQVAPDLYERLAPLQKDFLRLSGFADFEDLIEEVLAKRPAGTAYFDEVLVRPGDGLDVISTPVAEDLDRIAAAIGVARNNARVVLATLHGHEARGRLETADPFIETAARAAIDAGADMFVASGPHLLRGIEIYRGRPIFYSLGNFIMHALEAGGIPAPSYEDWGLPKDTLDPSLMQARIPYGSDRRFWRSVVARVTFAGGETGAAPADGARGRDGQTGGARPAVAAVELHPISLGFGEPIWRVGTPELAGREEATAILETLAELSRPYGTEIEIRGGVGRVRIG